MLTAVDPSLRIGCWTQRMAVGGAGLATRLPGRKSPLAAAAAEIHMVKRATFWAPLCMSVGIIGHETDARDMRRPDGRLRVVPKAGTSAPPAASTCRVTLASRTRGTRIVEACREALTRSCPPGGHDERPAFSCPRRAGGPQRSVFGSTGRHGGRTGWSPAASPDHGGWVVICDARRRWTAKLRSALKALSSTRHATPNPRSAMQHPRNPIIRLALVALAAWSTTASAGVVNVTVRDAAPWIGFVNRWAPPPDASTDRGAYLGGVFLDTNIAALPATVSGNVATLFPNSSLGATPSEVLELNLYVDSGTGGPPLAGETVRFTGATLNSTLAAPYVAYAFIREFSAGYALLLEEELVPLVAGQGFDFSMDTDFGNNVQYGFALFGPKADPSTVASLGSIAIGAVPEPSTLAMVLLGALGLATRARRQA